MNVKYHRQTLIGSDLDHPLIKKALSMLSPVEKAIEDVASGKINIKKYIDEITSYDQFMYETAKLKPQKSNPINTLQNKKYSTWREQKWAPIWELIRKAVSKKWNVDNLVLIQNQAVVESIYSNGYIKFKDVDGGIGFEHTINGQNVIIPIIAVEDKGGHACSTCFDGVAAQGLRLHRCLPNAYHVFITDNNVSVAKDKSSVVYSDINLIVVERGENKKREDYPKLVASRFEEVVTNFIDTLSKTSKSKFVKYNTIENNKKTLFREEIESKGIVWNI